MVRTSARLQSMLERVYVQQMPRLRRHQDATVAHGLLTHRATRRHQLLRRRLFQNHAEALELDVILYGLLDFATA